MTTPIRIAIVGMGKIAHDQHVPAIEADANFDLVATVSRSAGALAGRPHFHDLEELIASGVQIDAVSFCTPPQVRRHIAARAISEGLHVFLEKPPGATLAEVEALRDAAAGRGVTLFASWHSRHADGVDAARAWLSGREVRSAAITWREDVRIWHPGQNWIWEPGGFGVFDSGINALSIATRILPSPFFVEEAELDIPANRTAPIAARVAFRNAEGAPISMDLDFRQEGPQSWDILVETDAGTLELAKGGSILSIDGEPVRDAGGALHGEYPGLYRRFAAIVRAGESDVDVTPLRLVADTFLRARLTTVEDFVE